MATREDIYTAKILINDSEAANKLKKMEQRLTTLKQRRDDALRDNKIDVWKAVNKEIDKMEKNIANQKSLIRGLNHTVENLSTAKQKELETVIKAINKQLNSGSVERNSKEWHSLNETLKETKHQLRLVKNEGEEQQSAWGKFFKFLNDSWGGVLILFQSLTGISQSIRKSVQDFADMEEAMTDTRKYTGLADEQVWELNEDLKKMNTRTSREELNALAGSAGRRGITSKESIQGCARTSLFIRAF